MRRGAAVAYLPDDDMALEAMEWAGLDVDEEALWADALYDCLEDAPHQGYIAGLRECH